MFSQMAAALIEVYREPHAGLGAVRNPTGQMLVLLTGSPDRRQLLDVLDELYHPAHPNAAFLHVVSLLEGQWFSESDSRWFLEHAEYANKLTYLRGSVFDPRDLERAVPGALGRPSSGRRSRLQAVFVLSNRGTEEEDTQNQLRAMALRRYLTNAEIYVLLGSADSQHSLQALGISAGRILTRDVVKAGFLAANTATPGAGPLLVNLFSSDGIASNGVPARREIPREMPLSWGEYFSLTPSKTAGRFNPAWLSRRLSWRADRLKRCFPPLVDDEIVLQLSSSSSHVAVPVYSGGTHTVGNSALDAGDAEVTPSLTHRWWSWNRDNEPEVPPRPTWHSDYQDGLVQEVGLFSHNPLCIVTTAYFVLPCSCSNWRCRVFWWTAHC